LQHVPGALAAHVSSGEAAQLRVNNWGEFFKRRLVPFAPGP
jgi:hypothetical protein